MGGKTSEQSVPPPGFKQDAQGSTVNPVTGQKANWDGNKGAWVDSSTGKTIPRKENISAAPSSSGAPPADDSCEGLLQAAAWAMGLSQAYHDELAHSDSVVESEMANIADLTRELKDLIAQDKDLAQLSGETAGLGLTAAAGVSIGASAGAGTPIFAASGEIVGYVATSTVGLAVALPLAGAIIGTSLGLAVRNIWDAADRKADFKRALDLLDRARGRMAFFLEHSAALRIAAVDASARALAADAALDACEKVAKKQDPCRNERRWVAESDGYIEGLQRTLEAVRGVLSAASDSLARAEAAAAGATGDQAAIQKSTASYEGGVVRATTLEQGRLERLITEAKEERGKRARVLKDCDDKYRSTPPEPVGKVDDAGSNQNKILIGGIIVAIGGVLFGLAVLGAGKPPTPTGPPTSGPSAPATATAVASVTPMPAATPTPAGSALSSPGSSACLPSSGASSALLAFSSAVTSTWSEIGDAQALCEQLAEHVVPDGLGDQFAQDAKPPGIAADANDLASSLAFMTGGAIPWSKADSKCGHSADGIAFACGTSIRIDNIDAQFSWFSTVAPRPANSLATSIGLDLIVDNDPANNWPAQADLPLRVITGGDGLISPLANGDGTFAPPTYTDLRDNTGRQTNAIVLIATNWYAFITFDPAQQVLPWICQFDTAGQGNEHQACDVPGTATAGQPFQYLTPSDL